MPSLRRCIRFCAAIAVSLLWTVGTGVPTARADTVSNSQTRFTFDDLSLTSDCAPDEVVTIGGTWHFEYHFQTNAAGITTFWANGNYAGVKGVGQPSGDRYVATFNNVQVQEWPVADPNAYTIDFKQVTRLVSAGRATNFLVTARVGYSFDALGNFTLDHFDVRASCPGQ